MLSLMGVAGARSRCGSVRGERLMLSMKGPAYLCRSATPSLSHFAENVGTGTGAGWGFILPVKSCVPTEETSLCYRRQAVLPFDWSFQIRFPSTHRDHSRKNGGCVS